MSASVLVVSSEPVGALMAGPAIRALELARALAAHCDVTLAAPAPSAVDDPRLALVEAGFEDFDALLAAARRHDVVVAQELPPTLLQRVRKLPARLVIDLYNPTVMEVMEAVGERPARSQRRIQATIGLRAVALCAAADFIVCASERQRDLWLGGMALRGLLDLDAYRRDPTLRSLIDVVPFGVSEEPPRRDGPVLKGVWPGIGASDRVMVWAGGIWRWLDPLTAIGATEELGSAEPPVHLFFLGVERPGLEASDQVQAVRRAIGYARERGLEGRRVHFNPGWVPYAERGRWLLEADLGVSAHHDHLEARFSFRTRILDYLWAGLPVVTTRGDALADLVERHGLGRTVDHEDAPAFAAACRELLDDAAGREAAIERIGALAPSLRWSEAARPLIEYCMSCRELPPRRKRSGVVALATLGQYRRILPETYRAKGPAEAVRKVLRRLRRALG